jgi:hypothetical protein
MASVALGASTSQVEVTNISQYGFWLLLADEQLFLPFTEFPWFRDVAGGKILRVELPSPTTSTGRTSMSTCPLSPFAIPNGFRSSVEPALRIRHQE